MDIKKFLADRDIQNVPVGMMGCRAHGISFESCDYDVVVFDGKSQSNEIFQYGNDLVNLHHFSLDESRTEELIKLYGMKILSDDSWELGMLLSKLKEKHSRMFRDHAKNCLFESLFCCEKCLQGLDGSGVFSSCWQKCASYLLADAIFALNQKFPSSSHMMETARKFEKNDTNETISLITQTLGIERATPSLLERVAKSTVGFSDMVRENGYSSVIWHQYDYFVKNAMLADCYFYLGHINKANFLKIKDSVQYRPDLIHVLKIAFDLESDSSLISKNIYKVRDACHKVLSFLT